MALNYLSFIKAIAEPIVLIVKKVTIFGKITKTVKLVACFKGRGRNSGVLKKCDGMLVRIIRSGQYSLGLGFLFGGVRTYLDHRRRGSWLVFFSNRRARRGLTLGRSSRKWHLGYFADVLNCYKVKRVAITDDFKNISVAESQRGEMVIDFSG